MPVFGLDLSHYQALSLDLAQCKREGIDFVFLKATEGNTFTDSAFAANLAEARAAGLLVAAYHYVRASAAASDQVARIRSVVPRDVPVILDVEANSGGVGLTRQLIDKLRAASYRVPLLYLPRWYWQQIGSPSLAGLPPLWSSRYPDNVVGDLSSEWAHVPASYWNGYGGLDVAVLQFTSSVRIAGHQPIDANAYRGTREQLAVLLGGGQEDDDMLTDAEKRELLAGAASVQFGQAGVRFAGGLALAVADIRTQVAALTAAVGALANDPDLTADQVGALIDRAVADHTPTAEQLAASFLPAVTAAVHDALGEDNTDQANQIIDALAARLGAHQEGN